MVVLTGCSISAWHVWPQLTDSNMPSNQIKSNQITFIVTSPQHKCLGEWNSYERAPDSAEKQQTIYIWTDSAKKQQTIYLWTDSAKKQQTIYLWTDSAKKLHWSIYSAPDSAKKNNNNLHMDRQCKKNNSNLHMDRQCKKNNSNLHMDRQCKKNNSNLHMDRQCKKQQQFTYGQYIFTDCYRQCAKYTYIYSVRLVYYRDILNYQRHIIHRMGTSTLCTVSIHNVVYT